jgi:hypothetical protein
MSDDATGAIAELTKRMARDCLIERVARDLALLNCLDNHDAGRCWPNYVDDARTAISAIEDCGYQIVRPRNAEGMRHVVEGVGEIAEKALKSC